MIKIGDAVYIRRNNAPPVRVIVDDLFVKDEKLFIRYPYRDGVRWSMSNEIVRKRKR